MPSSTISSSSSLRRRPPPTARRDAPGPLRLFFLKCVVPGTTLTSGVFASTRVSNNIKRMRTTHHDDVLLHLVTSVKRLIGASHMVVPPFFPAIICGHTVRHLLWEDTEWLGSPGVATDQAHRKHWEWMGGVVERHRYAELNIL
ncbi:hypothetical protein B0H19DRAFT_1250722 [Mycena capillaripes]|nr:hypothetical protein B0H19DRAFT_1250722 [Mycena capillaripes]